MPALQPDGKCRIVAGGAIPQALCADRSWRRTTLTSASWRAPSPPVRRPSGAALRCLHRSTTATRRRKGWSAPTWASTAMHRLPTIWPKKATASGWNYVLALSLEHVLNDVRGISQVGQHEAGKGQIVQPGHGFGQTLVIAGQAAEPGRVAEAAFDYPAPRWRDSGRCNPDRRRLELPPDCSLPVSPGPTG